MRNFIILQIFVAINIAACDVERCNLRNGDLGYCIPPKDCDMIKEPNFVFYPDHFCEGRLALMCCNSAASSRGGVELITTTEAPSIHPITSSTLISLEDHPNYKLLNLENCGSIKSQHRIANGNKSAILEFPWAALVGYKIKDEILFLCGASLIAENFVLSAAHCLLDKEEELMNAVVVRLGEHTKSTPRDCQVENDESITCADPVQDVMIDSSDYILHDKFSHESLKNDIALIRLKEPAKIYQNNIKTICMPFNPNAKIPKMTVIGFGRTETTGNANSDVLMKVTVKLRENDECSNLLELNELRKLDGTQICAGDSHDSCKGDSGSSIEGFGSVGKKVKKVQFGIVSFGSRCGSSKPGVYTNVHRYLPWILDHMN